MIESIWLNHAHSSQRDVAALIRSEFSHNNVKILSSHKHFREDIFMVADSAFVEPHFAGDDGGAYADWAFGEATKLGIKAIVAMRQRRALAAARGRFADAGIRLAAGATTARSIEICDRKDQFTDTMKEIGVPVAVTIAVRTADELRAAIAAIEINGEACVKPVVGVYGRGYWRFQKNQGLYDVFAGKTDHMIDPGVFVAAFASANEPEALIVMEHLPGKEHSVDCVCDAGELVAHAKRQKLANCQIVSTGGPEVEIVQAIVRHLKLDGLVNIQTRADRHGVVKVLEVNTRPSGGIGYSAAAGINLPANAAQMLLGRPVKFKSLPLPVAVRIVDQPVELPMTSRRLWESAAA